MYRREGFFLDNTPTDYVSSIRFHETINRLLMVASWDVFTVRVFDVKSNSLKSTWTTDDATLDSIFLGSTHIAYAGLFGNVKVRDVNVNTEVTIGKHNDGVKNIEFLPKQNALVSGSWDKTIKIWDLRQQGSVATYDQCNGKVFCIDVVDEKIAVATSEYKALIWDLRNMKSYLILHRLTHPANCIALSPNKECYIIGHNDGCISVKYINRDPEIRKARHTFKCHRTYLGETLHIFGVASVKFYNENSIFATGGGNGYVNIWDGINKRHLYRYSRHHFAVTAMAFSPDRKKLAVACCEQISDPFDLEPLAVIIKVCYVNGRKLEQPIDNS